MLEVLDEIRNLSPWQENWKTDTKNWEENKNSGIMATCLNDVVVTSKFFEMISIILELNKQNHTLLFNIWIYNLYSCNIYSVFSSLKNCFSKTVHIIAQVWKVDISWFWKSIPSRTISSSTNLPRKKKSQNVWNRDLSINTEE